MPDYNAIQKSISLDLNGNFKESLLKIEAALAKIELLLNAMVKHLGAGRGIEGELDRINNKLKDNIKLNNIREKQSKAELNTLKGMGTEVSKTVAGGSAIAGGIKGMAIKAGVTVLDSLAKSAGRIASIPMTLLKGFGLSFLNLLSNSLSTFTANLGQNGISSYNMGSSLFTNSQARATSMQYGLNAGETYAFSQAKSMLGIQSDEDLMYMNGAQREKMIQYMEKYNKFYEEMESTGVFESIQDIQLTFKEFTMDLSNQFLSWIGQNKDSIMNIMNALLNIFELITPILTVVLNVASMLMSLLSNIVGGITNFNTVNINSTANISDSSAGEEFTSSLYRNAYNSIK